MKKHFIYILISLISAALIGLIAIQIYWIDNAVTLKEEEFKRDVNGALYAVVGKLEKIEAMNRIKAHQKGRELFLEKTAQMQSSMIDLNSMGYDTVRLVEKGGVQYKITEGEIDQANA